MTDSRTDPAPAPPRLDRLLTVGVEPGDVVFVMRAGHVVATVDVLPRPGYVNPYVQVVAEPVPQGILLPAAARRRPLAAGGSAIGTVSEEGEKGETGG